MWVNDDLRSDYPSAKAWKFRINSEKNPKNPKKIPELLRMKTENPRWILNYSVILRIYLGFSVNMRRDSWIFGINLEFSWLVVNECDIIKNLISMTRKYSNVNSFFKFEFGIFQFLTFLTFSIFIKISFYFAQNNRRN